MSKLATHMLFIFAFLVMFSVTALAQTHSVWSQKPLLVIDGDTKTNYNSFQMGDAATAWTEKTRDGYFHAVATVSSGQTYEFTLIAMGNSTADDMVGLWDVKRNGALVCSGCVGKAYGLGQPVGNNYFKIYIGDPDCYAERWHFSGYITNRYDF